MPRIVISTVGVRGDLNPFIAIGNGLRARGHEVVFAVETALRAAVADEGFGARYLTGDVREALSPHLADIAGGRTPLAALRPIVSEWLTVELRAKVEDLAAACAGADLLIARAGHLAAPVAAELIGLPWVQVTMTALTVPSAHTDPRLLPLPRRAPRLVNRAAWAAIELATRRLADPSVNRVRGGFGLPPVRNVMGRGGHSPHLTALAVSPAVSPRQPDWPTYVQATGYCLWDVPAGWREPAALTAFLDGSRPVVAVSFGSIAPWAGPAFERLYEAAVEAILASGAKALVIGAVAPSGERVLAISFAPFSQVYPRCVAAIHHGGPYSAGESLRAGIPALAVPWGIDQFFSAEQLARTGAGRTRHRRKFGAAAARRDLKALLAEPAYLRSAQSMAQRIAQEDGVATLCDGIERVLHGSHQPWRK